MVLVTDLRTTTTKEVDGTFEKWDLKNRVTNKDLLEFDSVEETGRFGTPLLPKRCQGTTK